MLEFRQCLRKKLGQCFDVKFQRAGFSMAIVSSVNFRFRGSRP